MTDMLTRHADPVTCSKEELDQSVEMLRTLVSLTAGQSDERIETVLELTVQGHGPSTIIKEAGLTRAELVEVVRGIGQRFRSRSDAAPSPYSTALFPLEPDSDVLATLSPKRRQSALAEAAQMRAENPLPLAWQTEFPEVGIRKTVAAIRGKVEVDHNLKSLALRVAASQVAPSSHLLTFASMRATWMLIQLGQFQRFAQDMDMNSRAAETVVIAYDALESARADSVSAMLKLQSNPPAEELEALAVRARPLAEAAVRRLEQVLANTRRQELDAFRFRGMTHFLEEISRLDLPANVGELNEGQVHRIGLMLGLHTEPISDRALATTEERLEELGLSADVPWLKGIWISAFSCNREDDFWMAVERLHSGDPAWATALQ